MAQLPVWPRFTHRAKASRSGPLNDQTIQLQFYSDAMGFRRSETADLEVQIDRRAPLDPDQRGAV